jgi:hypothetical protein
MNVVSFRATGILPESAFCASLIGRHQVKDHLTIFSGLKAIIERRCCYMAELTSIWNG